jgi:YHS domain-containing protein
MIAGIFRILIFAFLGLIIFNLLRFFTALSNANKSQRKIKNPSSIMVKDEMCNTYLPQEDAIKEIYEGKEYYLCSKECQQKFLEQNKNK